MTRQQLIAAIAAALGLVGVVSISLFIGSATNGVPNPITVDGQTITFTYTDDNAGEELKVWTSTSTYKDGLSHAEVYVAVINTAKAQSVELASYFRAGDSRKRVGNVSVLASVTQQFNDPVYTTSCKDETNATGTYQVCSEVQTGTTTRQETKNVWAPLDVVQRTAQELTKEGTTLSGVTRKVVEGFAAENKTIAFPISRNEVVYYKVFIEFPPKQSDEFMFEAIGSAGAYGFLR